jgi:flagellar biosynthesis protein FlhF
MQIRTYTAPDTRQAMRLVREAQGDDAVILSHRKVDGQVELRVAIDYDGSSEGRAAPNGGTTPAPRAEFSDAVAARVAAQAADDAAIGAELLTVRRMLETQLAKLAWNEMTRRAPLAAEVMRELCDCGFNAQVAAEAVDGLAGDLDLPAARRIALANLAARIQVREDTWDGARSVVAFVGATGVGKTTTIAKIAARSVLRGGTANIALVAADHIRIGAADQLARFARLLAVPCYAVAEPEELPELLARLAQRKLVLVDTPGFGPRDGRLCGMLEVLQGLGGGLETCACIAAGAQAALNDEMLRALEAVRPASAIVTKTDEASSLGGVLSVIIERALPLIFIAEGPRVVEDLRRARSQELIAKAVALAEQQGSVADEELLCRRVNGGSRAHLANPG